MNNSKNDDCVTEMQRKNLIETWEVHLKRGDLNKPVFSELLISSLGNTQDFLNFCSFKLINSLYNLLCDACVIEELKENTSNKGLKRLVWKSIHLGHDQNETMKLINQETFKYFLNTFNEE